MIGDIARYRFVVYFTNRGAALAGPQQVERQMVERRSSRSSRSCAVCGNAIDRGDGHLVDTSHGKYRIHVTCGTTVE